MSVFFDMFLPSRRHVEDERNRLEWTRDEEGEGDPHRGPIDLDSGVVTIAADGAGARAADKAAGVTAGKATSVTPIALPAVEPFTEPAFTRPVAPRSRHAGP